MQSQLAAEATPMKVPSEQKAGIPTSIRSGSCSFLCAANAMSSYCVLEQCYCGPELHFEDVPEETAEEEEANIAHDVSVFPIMLPSHLLSLNSTQGCIYIYICFYGSCPARCSHGWQQRQRRWKSRLSRKRGPQLQSDRVHSCSFLCASNAMSSHCVLEQC